MTLEQVIASCEKSAERYHKAFLRNKAHGGEFYQREAESDRICEEHERQLAAWLRELQERRKAPEIIYCHECIHFQCNMRFDGYVPKGADAYECRRGCGGCDPMDYCCYGERAERGEPMADIGDICDFCQDEERDCMMCPLGNPCLGCEDYDQINHTCKSNGGCAPERKTE